MRRKLPVLLSLAMSLGLLAAACAQEETTVQAESEPEAEGGHEAEAEGHEDEGEGHEDEGEGHEDQGTKEIGGQEATYHGTTDVSGESGFELELDDFYFGPTVLEGESGQQLALGLYNEGDEHHTFTIDGVVDEELPSGADGIEIDVTFPDSGALVFYCTFHRGQGMVGALSVDGSLETGASGSSGVGDDSGLYD